MKVVFDSLTTAEPRVETGRRVELVTEQGARAVLVDFPSQGCVDGS
jgi:hypothetical protein